MKQKPPTAWELADFFRAETPTGWRPSTVEFQRELAPVRAAGMTWHVSLSARAGSGEPLELVVWIAKDDRRAARGIPARQRLRLFVLLETVERTLWRRGYRGSFVVDDHAECRGHFSKSLKTIPSMKREIARLASLKIGDRGA